MRDRVFKPDRLGPAHVQPLVSPSTDGISEGQVRCGILRALPDVLDGLHTDAGELFAEAGITRHHFDDPDNLISYSTGGRLLHRAVEKTGVRHLGILVGQPVTLSAMGAVGFLMRASPTVAHALGIVAEHFRAHDRGGHVGIEVAGSAAMLGYRVNVSNVEAIDQIYMIAAASACNFLRELCAPGWQPLEVQLPFRRPADVQPLRDVLAAHLVFDADQMNVVFPTGDLAQPVASADPVLYRMMSERVAALEARFESDLAVRVRDILRTLIFLPDASGAIVANRLGMSLRTLKRRLHDHGESLQEIRDKVRCEAACQMLKYTEKSALEIAVVLRYADASAFSRAFHRWQGIAPSEWRGRLPGRGDREKVRPAALRR